MSRRFKIITISLAAHFGLGIALFASGVWHIDRLEAGRMPIAIGAPMPQPEAAASGSPQLDRFKNRPKRIVKEPVQPPKQLDREVAFEREGPAKAPHGGDGPPEATGGCTVPPCGPIASAPMPPIELPDPPVPPAPPEPKLVSPTTLRAIRVSGDDQIGPSDATKQEMMRDGKLSTRGNLLVCVSERGTASASLQSSTGYPAYDARLLDGVRRWRYRPHTVGGAAQSVCGVVTFVYSMK